jgi:primosomal protein N' (replication factor Y) (superfamily II helicase)
MEYYEVYVADSSFKGTGALTYQYSGSEKFGRGRLVVVPIKQKQVYGVVIKQVKKPAFAARELALAPVDTPLPSQLIDLAAWITTYYPSGIGVTLQQFLPQKIYPTEKIPPLKSASEASLPDLPALTDEQRDVLHQINHPDTYILHGETGSGKTRVYIELAKRTLQAGRSCVVLTPEIGLTPQLVQNFQTVFGTDQVVLTHSQLTVKDRSLLWQRILVSDKPLIVLGPRSALFSPLRDVGLIILDEAHESSYKQEQAPHYHASKVAAKLASLHKATTILGSATPSINDYFMAEAKQKPILRMRENARLTTGQQTTTRIVNLTDRQQFTRQPHISDVLVASIEQSLNRQEQSLVFLNRRGTARVILCQQCGWQAACPHCDLPLTYHGDVHNIRCHTCGYTAAAPTNCPECSSTNIVLKSIGTKAIVDELTSIFPSARIQRFDTDNAKDERLEAHYNAVRDGAVDIIVGTQLIAKGLDLPKLSTVGVVVADTSLYLPDYSSSERSYQLLRQVIGRVGRGHRSGSIIIQTYDPANPVIRAAAKNDGSGWDSYYHNELDERKAFTFPPYCYTLKISCRRATTKSAMQAAEKATGLLRMSGLRISVDGPMPAFHEKAAGKYQWQAIIKSKDRGELIKVIKMLPANWSFDIDPGNLL